jgi:integrase
MAKKSKNSVEKSVESAFAPARQKKKKPKYKKGKFPHTLILIETGALFARKAVRVEEMKIDAATGEKTFYQKQKQIWRVVDPPTKERVAEVVQDIDDYIMQARSGQDKPLSLFSDIAARYAAAELTEAVYSPTGQKIAGRRSLAGTTSMMKTVLEFFGHREISNITFGDLEDFKRTRINTPIEFKSAPPRPRSIRTVNYELSFLRAIFNFAYRRRWLDRTPFADGKKLIDKSAETRRDKTWTREEEEKALALCTGARLCHMKPVIICSVDGGFRRSELLNSKWSEVSFENGVMLARSYKGKSLHTRPVYMTKRMMKVLIEWKRQQKKIKTIKDKSLVIGYADIKHGWETIRTKIGRPDLNLHDLRHVFGTRLDQSKKVSLKEIQLLLGHSDIKTTQIYLNPTAENLRGAIEVLEVD